MRLNERTIKGKLGEVRKYKKQVKLRGNKINDTIRKEIERRKLSKRVFARQY